MPLLTPSSAVAHFLTSSFLRRGFLFGRGCTCGCTKGLSARPLGTFGCPCILEFSLFALGACLRAWQGLSARPCTLRGRLSTRRERARGCPWVQESSPRYRAKDVGLVSEGSARGSIGPQSCPPAGDPSRVPACLVSWRQGKFAIHGGFNF